MTSEIYETWEHGIRTSRIVIDTSSQEETDLRNAVEQAIIDLDSIQAAAGSSVQEKRIAQITKGIIKFLAKKFLLPPPSQ